MEWQAKTDDKGDTPWIDETAGMETITLIRWHGRHFQSSVTVDRVRLVPVITCIGWSVSSLCECRERKPHLCTDTLT